MIPMSDDNSAIRTTPMITYVLIALNVLMFLLELASGEEFVMKWAFVPSRFLAAPLANVPTLFTAMFMHAGWAHLIGNMLYLWIFGDNVEDRFGKIKYLIFYLASGIAATFSQMFFSAHSDVPNVGASGAIAGVLGAYILLYPQGKVNVLVGRSMTQMSALVVIGFWFALQFLSGVGSTYSSDGSEGGVAYMAHVGGFIAGLLMAFIFSFTDRYKPVN